MVLWEGSSSEYLVPEQLMEQWEGGHSVLEVPHRHPYNGRSPVSSAYLAGGRGASSLPSARKPVREVAFPIFIFLLAEVTTLGEEKRTGRLHSLFIFIQELNPFGKIKQKFSFLSILSPLLKALNQISE